MYLNSKQLSLLFIPFLLMGIVYFFADDIVKNVKNFFPEYSEYTNKVLDKKAEIYLKMEKNNAIYQHIISSLDKRKELAPWVADNVLYGNVTTVDKKSQEKFIAKYKRKRSYSWRLQAVFPDKNAAIINGKIVHLYHTIDGGKLIAVQTDKILIQYEKGQKWVYLFQ